MTMHCQEFEMALISDDPADKAAAKRHAARCLRCRTILERDEELLAQVSEWKSKSALPPAHLEARIAAAVKSEWNSKNVTFYSKHLLSWAAAALFLFAIGVVTYSFWPKREEHQDLISAVHNLDRLQREYARAIAQLEREAEPILAKVGDNELGAQSASILISYRDRLTHLDTVIAEVQDFLNQQPGHSGAHKVLLAAYREKDELLRKILRIPEDCDEKIKEL